MRSLPTFTYPSTFLIISVYVRKIIPSRSIIQFGDDDDLHARAHLRAHNDYKFAHAPATAVVATYAKAQANIADGGGGGGGGASRARCAGA